MKSEGRPRNTEWSVQARRRESFSESLAAQQPSHFGLSREIRCLNFRLSPLSAISRQLYATSDGKGSKAINSQPPISKVSFRITNCIFEDKLAISNSIGYNLRRFPKGWRIGFYRFSKSDLPQLRRTYKVRQKSRYSRPKTYLGHLPDLKKIGIA